MPEIRTVVERVTLLLKTSLANNIGGFANE